MLRRTPGKLICFLILIFISPLISASGTPLPADKAFQLSVKTGNTDSLSISWQIQSEYYLYKNRFHFSIISPKSASLGTVFFPAGKTKTDLLGTNEVYFDHLTLSLPFINPGNQNLKLKISYQGCSSEGFCYPPVNEIISLNAKRNLQGLAPVSHESDPASSHEKSKTDPLNILSHSNFLISLLIFFGLGILLAFTPCILPMLPILSGIIVGQGPNITTKRAFWLSLTYILSMSVTFAFIGIIVALLGSNLQTLFQTPWIIISFAILFILLALSLFDFYEIKIPEKLQAKILQSSKKQHAGTFIGVILMGIFATLIVSPCVTPPLVGALAYIAQSGNIYLGGAALFFMSLGMGLPLLFVGTSLGKILPKAGAWLENIKHFFGLLLLGIAVLLISRLVSDTITQFMWGSLGILTAIYLFSINWPLINFKRIMGLALGMILFLYSTVIVVSNSLQLLHLTTSVTQNKTTQTLFFKNAVNLDNLRHLITQAKNNKKPVLIYFSANWCSTCQEIKKYVFTDARVVKQLKDYLLIKIDVTHNTDEVDKLEKTYDVIAPPVLIFYNAQGEELKSKRIVGSVSADEFLSIAP